MPFFDHIEYPVMDKLLEYGPCDGTWYEYVTSSYIDGIVPYLEPVKAVLLSRYDKPVGPDDPISDEDFEKWCTQLGGRKFINLGDNTVYIGETTRYWWMLYLDCDVSDCRFGRLAKSHTSREQLMAWFVEQTEREVYPWVPQREIPVDVLKRGWLTFC